MSQPPTSNIADSAWGSFELLQSGIDAMDIPFFVKDRQHRWVALNAAFCRLMGMPRERLIGLTDYDFVPSDQAEAFWREDDAVLADGVPRTVHEVLTSTDGAVRDIETRKWPVRDAAGQIVGLCAMINDITELKRREHQATQLLAEVSQQQTIIESQDALLDELSVPVIQVWDSILLLPLIGVVESRRAARVLESLLDAVGRMGAELVIIDITGVPVVDTSVAAHLLRAVQATQLLGCQSVLVGIKPEIAQTLVGLGVDFSRITTRATLQNGLEYALKRLNYDVRMRAAAGA